MIHIELPAKLLDDFLRSNKSNINQSHPQDYVHKYVHMYGCIYTYIYRYVHIYI